MWNPDKIQIDGLKSWFDLRRNNPGIENPQKHDEWLKNFYSTRDYLVQGLMVPMAIVDTVGMNGQFYQKAVRDEHYSKEDLVNAGMEWDQWWPKLYEANKEHYGPDGLTMPEYIANIESLDSSAPDAQYDEYIILNPDFAPIYDKPSIMPNSIPSEGEEVKLNTKWEPTFRTDNGYIMTLDYPHLQCYLNLLKPGDIMRFSSDDVSDKQYAKFLGFNGGGERIYFVQEYGKYLTCNEEQLLNKEFRYCDAFGILDMQIQGLTKDVTKDIDDEIKKLGLKILQEYQSKTQPATQIPADISASEEYDGER